MQVWLATWAWHNENARFFRLGTSTRRVENNLLLFRERMRKCVSRTVHVNFLRTIGLALLISLLGSLAAAVSQPDDTTADAVAAAFVKARQSAHLSKLTRIGRNPFGEKICKHDMRMGSGLIEDVLYETADPTLLPDVAQNLAEAPDRYRVTARFGIGVCRLSPDASGKTSYSIFIATYESRWTSFWRIFWE